MKIPKPSKPKPFRSMSQPDVSRPARPEVVLSRSFYNHERGHPSQPLPFVPDYREYRPSSATHQHGHQRSRSASDSICREPPAGASHARSRSYQSVTPTPMRPLNLNLNAAPSNFNFNSSHNTTSLPPAPNYKLRTKHKPIAPPTSFRPFAAVGDQLCSAPNTIERPSSAKPTYRSPTPDPASASAIASPAPLPRSQSHSTLPERARLSRIRTNSLSSLSSVARGALSAVTGTAAPLKNILHPHPNPQFPLSKGEMLFCGEEDARRSDEAWVRVDLKPKECGGVRC